MHAEQLWLVSFADNDDRELTTDEVARALGRHEVNSSTLVWREGLANWLPLSAFEEFSGLGASSPGFIWPATKSDAPPAVIEEEEPVTVKSLRPPLPGRRTAKQRDIKSTERNERTKNGNAVGSSRARRETQPKELTTVEEELDANDLLWLPADSEPISSDFLGLSRPDASLIPPPINVPSLDPLGARDSKSGALEAAMALRVRVAPMPNAAVTTRPVSKDSAVPAERKPVVCLPWVLAASLVTAGGYFLITQQQIQTSPRALTPSLAVPVEHVATPSLPAPLPTIAESSRDLPAEPAIAANPVTPEPKPEPIAPVEAPKPEPAVAHAPPASPAVDPPKTASTREPVVEKPREEPRAETPPARKSRQPSAVASTSDESPATDPFDRAAAMATLDEAAARASACRKEGDPSGTADVRITFSTSGRATQAVLSGPPFAGTTTGSCIATAMRAARVPAFLGERTTVQKRVVIK